MMKKPKDIRNWDELKRQDRMGNKEPSSGSSWFGWDGSQGGRDVHLLLPLVLARFPPFIPSWFSLLFSVDSSSFPFFSFSQLFGSCILAAQPVHPVRLFFLFPNKTPPSDSQVPISQRSMSTRESSSFIMETQLNIYMYIVRTSDRPEHWNWNFHHLIDS